jgi:DNA (cytosine-5)-methyltransferase 1
MAMRIIPKTPKHKYAGKLYSIVDLCCGAGGIRLAFDETQRVRSVFSADIALAACVVYNANFGEVPSGDFTERDPATIPAHDILLAGFPCQPFSFIGKRKGFKDARGNVFSSIAGIIAAKRPAVVFLENVKGLVNHDGGRTFDVIMRTLHDLGYVVRRKVIRAGGFGVAQKRERIYIVALRKDLDIDFTFPEGTGAPGRVADILETGVAAKYWLSPTLLASLEERTARNAAKGNGFGMVVLDPDGMANTLTCGGSGRERNLIVDRNVPAGATVNARFLRRLTPREFARLQGFPDSFLLPVSDTQAYRLMGNSVAVPVVAAIAHNLVAALDAAFNPCAVRKAA